MQDELGLEADEDVAHAVGIGDVADDRRDERTDSGRDELLFCLVEKYLALIEHDKAGGRTPRHLTTKLGADAPAGTRDKHGATLDHRVDGLVVEFSWFTAEDVLDGDRTDIARTDAAAGQLGHGRHHEYAQVAGGCERAHFADAAHRRSGQSQDDFGDAIFLGELGHPLRGANHRHAMNMKVMLGGVIIQKADGLDAVAAAAHELRGELRPGLAGADNRDTLYRALGRLLLAPETFAQGAD